MSLDEYWSEEGNIDREQGMTYIRMNQLVEVHSHIERVHTFQTGLAVNAAMAEDPQKALGNLLSPKPAMPKLEDLPAMLRPAKIRKPQEPQS